MLDDASSIALSLATNQMQANLISVKIEADAQRQIANLLAAQAEAGQVLSTNPPHLGQNIDTSA